MFLHATRRDLDRAYLANIKAVDTCSGGPASLLLFYGLECGLKAVIMKERGANITSELPLIAEIGHDLRACLKALNAPATLKLSSTRTKQERTQTVANPLLHQAFRYGVELEDGKEIIEELKKVHEWLIRRMR